MARGRYPARLILPPIQPEVAARYRMFWPSEDLYQHPEQFPPLTAEGLFGASGPLAVDMGCATGEFLRGLAARQPETFFLGIDTARKPLDYCALQAHAQGLANIRLLQADLMLLVPLLQPASLAAIYLHFPVPFETTRKRKHHTYAPAMLDRLRGALVPGGRLSLMTDNPTVAQAIQDYIAERADVRSVPEAEWRLQIDDSLKSPFQRRWERRGRTIWRTELASSREG